MAASSDIRPASGASIGWSPRHSSIFFLSMPNVARSRYLMYFRLWQLWQLFIKSSTPRSTACTLVSTWIFSSFASVAQTGEVEQYSINTTMSFFMRYLHGGDRSEEHTSEL